ncbi:neo-calmodulin [Eurytemora carolleeae]|uniref:neo-calmodulin n=1 Tax=Eurytemora carolleeae TaxID=1294199 RepID=UPI000C788B7C|nr:neo-calmodulin [Eurytemora carolleeae]|eukprot:XP_023329478.1 neo-calmodulin-like [Eurytemora affinis]
MGSWLVDPVKYFKKFDVNNDGKLSADELKPALRSLGFNPRDSDVQRLIAAADTNGDGVIEYDNQEFMDLLSELDDDPMSNELLEAFQFLDKDGNGYISSEELRALVTNHGSMTQAEADEMIRMADTNGDGQIDYKEFIALGTQSPLYL